MIIQEIITILNDLTQRASSRRGLEQSLYNHSDTIQPKVLEVSVRNQMKRTISVRSDRNLWSTLTGCVISVVQTEMSPSMIVVPSTALPYPALYKNNNQTLGALVGSLQPECTVPLGMSGISKHDFKVNRTLSWMESAPEFTFVYVTCTSNFNFIGV